jgi:hypothetical protein
MVFEKPPQTEIPADGVACSRTVIPFSSSHVVGEHMKQRLKTKHRKLWREALRSL